MSVESALLLGIDGGGTSCRARICAGDGTILGEGLGGPANVCLGLDKAFAAVLTATREALFKAGLDESDLDQLHAGLGLAGVNLASLFREASALPLPFAQWALVTDIEIARLGAHDGGDGGVVIVGTGSCAEGRIGKRVVRLGGWGFEISDQGSGAAIGRAAMRHSLLVHDGLVPKSGLGQTILAEFNNDPESMVHWAKGAEPSDYARYGPLVLTLAGTDDAAAIAIIRTAAAAVDDLILGMATAGVRPIALLGGLAEDLNPWLGADARARLVAPQGTALDGAVRLAQTTIADEATQRRTKTGT